LATCLVGAVLCVSCGQPTEPPAEEASEAAAEPAPGIPAPSGEATARDPQDDRSMTASTEAFEAYLQGTGLLARLPVQAAARLQRSLQLDPGFAPAGYRLAVASILGSNAAGARRAIESARANQERLPEPYRTALGPLARFSEGAFDLTRAELAEAFKAQPDDLDLHLIAGMLFAFSCDHFDPNSVIRHFEPVLSVEPDFPFVRRQLLAAYEMKSMHDWSLSRAVEFLSEHPDRSDAIAEVGRVRIVRGEYGDAIEAADEIVRRGEDVFAHDLAPAFILTGHFEQLEGMYDPEAEASNAPEANVLTHLHAGINDTWRGRFGGSAEHFERGAEFLPAPWQKSRKALLLLLLGRVFWAEGRQEEARAALEGALRQVGPQPLLEYALGMNELRAGRPGEVERVIRRLGHERNRSRPGWTEPWRRLMQGELLLSRGEAAQGLERIREAWSLARPLADDCIAGHVDAYFLDALGRAALEARRPQEALEAFQQVQELGYRGLHQPIIGVLASYHAGRALEALGRTADARKRFQRFLAYWDGADPPPEEVGDARNRLTTMVY